MKLFSRSNILALLFLSCMLLIIPVYAFADTYEMLTEIPGFEAANEAGNFTELINTIYKMAIALSIALAVIILVVEGVRYSASDIPGVKTNIKQRIPMVLGGLVLLIGAYMFLEIINPQLLQVQNLADRNPLPDNREVETPDHDGVTTSDGVTFESGQTGKEALQSVTNPTLEEYEDHFGRRPLQGRMYTDDDGTRRVYLSRSEREEIFNNLTNGGTQVGVQTENGGTRAGGSTRPTNQVNVTEEGQQAVAAAISLCPSIPESWADSSSLFQIIANESGGRVGLPNYGLEGYMEQEGISHAQITSDIRNNVFYSRHCCRVTSQSTREAQENGTSQCDRDSQSGLMDFTAAQAAEGIDIYSHVAGKCTSAAGVGQLLNVNMHRYQPNGVAGFNDASEELCGMMNYIQDRYNNPENAWNEYRTGIGY